VKQEWASRVFNKQFESFVELFEQSQIALVKLKPGDHRYRGRDPPTWWSSTYLKSEGVVPIEQFRNEQGELEINVGDTVKVALESLENGFGETVLSREKAKRAMVWDELETSMEAGEIVTGRISGKVKGGFTVDIKDVRAFLPGSLVDVRRP
jgi:small subunit ribosomal protein S1